MADAMAHWIRTPMVTLTEQDIRIMLKQKGVVDYQSATEQFYYTLMDEEQFNW